MLVHIQTTLPCAQYVGDDTKDHEPCLCGRLTHEGILSPSQHGTWEFLPICPMHLVSARKQYLEEMHDQHIGRIAEAIAN